MPDKVSDNHRARAQADRASCNYAPYFLTVHDIVRFARSQGILCQGRGSAANSRRLLLPRHHRGRSRRAATSCSSASSRASGSEPPDIDVDFEHERREEVIQYIYEKYGRDRAGIAATVISLPRALGDPRGRQGLRPVGGRDRRARQHDLGLVGRRGVDGGRCPPRRPRSCRPPHAPGARARRTRSSAFRAISPSMSAASSSPAAGSTRSCRSSNAAMDDRTIIEWDKDDLDALGILKVDVLGARHADLPAARLRSARRSITAQRSRSPRSRAEDPAVYDMLCRADTLGVFQIESRAQMTMLPRLKPTHLLRSRHRGGDRAARPDPGRHGASLSAPARRARSR